MRGSGGKLERKQEQAIVALLSCATVADAAKSCGVSEASLWRWLALPEFASAYADARRQAMQTALSCLQKATGDATSALVSIVNDTDAPKAVRVSAARAVLEYAFRGVELLDTQARLMAIEAMLKAQEGTPT